MDQIFEEQILSSNSDKKSDRPDVQLEIKNAIWNHRKADKS